MMHECFSYQIMSMQMAADLGHSLAAATNSIGSQLMTLAGQSSAAAVDDWDTFQARFARCGLLKLLGSQRFWLLNLCSA